MSLPINTQLGQYQLAEILHQGRISTVYKAYQPALERYVAIKVLPAANDGSQFTARFRRAARMSAALQHPNILPTYDYGEQGNLLYLVLRYVEGGATLRDMLVHPIDRVSALQIIGNLLGALEYAHKRGIIHRNIKPANMLMLSRSWPLLADFGIAKILSESQSLTVARTILGTPAYMSPEQATGQSLDIRTDLYSAGVILYEMLTNRLPFDAETPIEILQKHVAEAPLPPRSINPGLPIALEEIVLRALEKNPAARYQHADEMAEALRQVTPPIAQPAPIGRITALYESGAQAFAAQDWAQAVDLLSQVTALDPGHEDAIDMLAIARSEQLQAPKKDSRSGPIAGAVAQAQTLMQQGQQKQQRGDLPGALADYRAAHAAAAPGALRDRLAALIDEAASLIAGARGQPAPALRCPQCGQAVQQEWVSCPYCRKTLGLPTLGQAAGAQASLSNDAAAPGLDPPRAPATPPRTAMSRSQSSRQRLIWAMLMLVAILLGAIGTAWAIGSRAAVVPAAQRPSVPVAARASPQRMPSPAPSTPPASSPQPSALAAQATLPAPSAPPISSPVPTSQPDAVVDQDQLRLRDGPSTDYGFQNIYARATTLKIIGKLPTATWLKVQTPDGRIGWMRAQDLTINIAIGAIPVAEAIPSPLPSPKPTVKPPAQTQPTTKPPAAPTAQATPTETLAVPSELPATPTELPATPTEPPAAPQPTSKPPIGSPAAPTEAPTDLPAAPTEAPTDLPPAPTEAPTDLPPAPTEAPTDLPPAPTEPAETGA